MMQQPGTVLKEFIDPLQSSISMLQDSLDKLNKNSDRRKDPIINPSVFDKKYSVKKFAHLEFIRKLVSDIYKITSIIVDGRKPVGAK
jgi:hypothetical protein